MKNKNFYNLITITLIISLVIPLPYITFIKKAKAQTSGGYSTSGATGGGLSGGIAGYLSGLAPAIAQLPLCKGKLNGAIEGLFRKSGVEEAWKLYNEDYLGDDKMSKTEFEINWKKEQESASSEAEAIEVIDKQNRKIALENARTSKDNQKILKALEENDTCWKSIGRMVTKMMLQKITVSTVSWIQGGYHGKPSFVENPGEFFGDIAKNEILQFGLEIDDPTLYPFGKAFMRSQAQAFNTHFAQNAQYSLNELIQNTTPQYSAETFQKDFSQGGWSAWTYMTSVPANNPLGFQLMASNELQKRLEGTSMSRANEIRGALTQAAGFLGDERCADPKGLNITREEDMTARRLNASYEKTITLPPPTGPEGGITSTTPKIIKNPIPMQPVCNRWEYVTPGKMISEAATTAVNYPSNNLLRAEDLNDSIAAILDAVLSRFSSDLMNKGFSNFSDEGRDGGFVLDASSLLVGDEYNQIEKDFTRFQRGSIWLEQHPNFNIRTDLTQALIDEQRIYRIKLEEQNKILGDLNKTIYQLDYCIPGPHPGWEQDSRRVLSAVENSIVSKTANDMKNISVEEILKLVKTAGYITGLAVGAAIGTAVFPGFGTAVGAAVGFIIGTVADFIAKPDDEEKLDIYYAGIFKNLTGIHMSKKNTPPAKIRNKHEITSALDAILLDYAELINKYFPIESLPTVAKDAALEFRKTQGYVQMIANNNDNIVLMNGIIKRLGALKTEIDALNTTYPTGLFGDNKEYEEKLEPFKSEFSRLSLNMVTGDDIAEVDGLAKQAKDEIKYVYEDLLTGEYGCEKDLILERQLSPDQPLHSLIKGTIRMPYPFPIWYDYIEGTELPVPEELKIYTKKTTGNILPKTNTQNGPGFLSSVYFNNTEKSCSYYKTHSWVLDCIDIAKLFRHVNSWTVTVGVNSSSFGGWFANKDYEQKQTSFEQTIGVY